MAIAPGKLAGEVTNTIRQTRFAGILALTRTAFQARKEVQDSLDKNFTLRNKWTKSGIRVEPATKQKEYAEVYSKDWYIAQHEEGIKRKPPKRNTLGEGEFEIPTKDFFDLLQGVSKKRIIPNKLKPKSLLRTKVAGNKPFLLKSGVYVRTSTRSDSLRLLYRLDKDSQRIRKKNWFHKPVLEAYNRNIERNYNKALLDALKTGR